MTAHVRSNLVCTGFMGDSMDISDFLSADITGKLVTNLSYTEPVKSEIIKFYKVTPRAQVCLGV